jgi:hydrogenase maturation factor
MARASGSGLVVDKAAIVTQDVVLEVCRIFDIDPYKAISEGTLVAAARPESADGVLSALSEAGIPASVVGELRPSDAGVSVIDESGEHALEHPEVDPFWVRFEEYLARQAQRTAERDV